VSSVTLRERTHASKMRTVYLARGARGWRVLAVLAFAGAAGFAAPQSSSVSPTSATPAASATPSASATAASPAGQPAPSATPTPFGPPTVDGDVTGAQDPGHRLEIRIDATVPGGWDRLHLVEATLLVDGKPVDELTYDIEDAKMTLGELSVIAGTGASATGEYLRVAGSKIVLTTGGANLSLVVGADVVSAIPDDARFELGVVGDRGETASVRRTLEAAPTDSGPTWASVITAIVVALLAGGFVGNIFASRRRPPVRPSVYATIDRRLAAERRSEKPR
jgi:hypothetical protein